MEQNTSKKLRDASARMSSLRTEAFDLAGHNWFVLIVMNFFSNVLPLLLPAAYAVFVVHAQLPVRMDTVAVGVVALVAGLVLQGYFSMALGAGLRRMADGHDVRVSETFIWGWHAGRAISLFVLGFVVLCAAAIPGAAVIGYALTLCGTWKYVLLAVGAVLALALVLFTALSGCLSLYVMAEDKECGAMTAFLRSARLMKGRKMALLRACVPSLVIWVALCAGMALLLWPMTTTRDLLTDALMYAGAAAFVILTVYLFMAQQALTACLYASIEE